MIHEEKGMHIHVVLIAKLYLIQLICRCFASCKLEASDGTRRSPFEVMVAASASNKSTMIVASLDEWGLARATKTVFHMERSVEQRQEQRNVFLMEQVRGSVG